MSAAPANPAPDGPYRCSWTTCSTSADPAVKRVDFYVLSDTAADARLRFACRLAEKAVDRGHRVYVQTSSPALTQHLDELMWTFSDRSFLAHEVANDAAPPPHPRVLVLLGQVEAPPSHRELLINLTDRLPDLDAYERII